MCVYSSSHKCLPRAGVRASATGTQDPGKTLPTSLPTEGWALPTSLGWAGAKEGCVCECAWVSTHM